MVDSDCSLAEEGGKLGLDGGLALGTGQLAVTEPLGALRVGPDSGVLALRLDSRLLGLGGNLLAVRVGKDLLVHILVELLGGLDLVLGHALLPLGELALELGGVLLLEEVHVVVHVDAEDVIAEDLGIEVSLDLLDLTGSLASLVDDFSTLPRT